MTANRTKAASRWLQLTAAIVGNALEWYDFSVFAYLAVIISKVFFPAEGEYTGLLLTLATFGVGFLMRPLGGIAIGAYADRRGRKSALQLIIGLMTASLLLMVFTPSYNSIGIAAPLLIVLARLMQGLATGGEFASATAYLVEAAPEGRKGYYGAWQMFGQGLSNLGGALTGLLLTSFFSEQQLLDGMWRIPFVIGLLIAPLGWWIRRHLEEPKESVEARANGEKVSLRAIFAKHPRAIAANLSLAICATTSVYIFFVYMPTFLTREFHIPMHDAFLAQAMGLFAFIVTVPVAGALSDGYGRKIVMLTSLLPYAVFIYPLFSRVHSATSPVNLVVIYTLLSICLGGFFGPFSTALGEQFPTTVRSSGLAICYNLAVMIFGGFAQFIVTWLIQSTGVTLAPVLYTLAGSVIGVIGCLLIVPTSKSRLSGPVLVGKTA
ncbi:MFS transporter [Bradyrhizobium manausense]|uniref:MFS transporter n=1 Tax=Bradyrhizobium manausense TaxID=989370 RepID=UPI001BA93C6B|nr:MFS transporter [Bradyrhizobium manausense]MBR0828555.1 MFS transporter [Bradyrhizobium manausense]